MDENLEIFHDFCNGDVFWNSSNVFKAQPEFSLCFMNTVLVWIPCAFLWIAAPLFVLRICLSRPLQPLPFSKLNFAKSIISALVAVMVGLQLQELHVSEGKCVVDVKMSPALETAYLIKVATFILTIVLQQYQRHKGIKTSAIPFAFWILLLLSEMPAMYSNISKQKYFPCLSVLEYYIYFILVIIQLVLHCYAETQRRTSQCRDANEKTSCPEEDASVINHITYCWFSPLMKIIYKGSFDVKKLWDLPSRMKNEAVAPLLEKTWNEELTRCDAKRSSKTKNNKFRHCNGYGLLHSKSENRLHRMYIETWMSSEDTPLLGSTGTKPNKKDSDEKYLEPNLYKALIKVFWKFWVEAVSYLMIGQTSWYMIPFVLQYIIKVVDGRDSDNGVPMWIGYFLCVAILMFTFANFFFHHTSYTHMLELSLNVKTALMALVYQKALRMKTSGSQTTGVGEIVNYIAVDCQRVQDAFTFSGYSVILVVIVILTVLQLWELMGIAALGCLVLLLIVLPTVGFIGIQQFKIQKELLALKGSRIKLLNEVINGIKVLKMYAWESSFINKIEEIRSAEVNKLWKYAWLSAMSVVLSMHTPVVMTFIVIAIHVTSSTTHVLDPRVTFTAVTIVNIIRFAISLFPTLVNGLVQAYVSVGRIQAFLRTPDINEDNVKAIKHSEFAVSIEDGEFSWKEDQAQMTLKDINLQVREGELLAVVGQVGSGKSSLISAILGEMERFQGNVKTKGSVAYVPQVAWIQNMKLQDNILFGKEYRHNKYTKVIEACALIPDLNILPGGDETEIGERGINVSGGQKQRISLARAVYNNADIYLLDDPLSAVDSHVGKDLFNNVISNNGLLQNKTRILVTHGLHWLPMVDRIVVLVDGRISEVGSYTELISHDGPFAQYLHKFLQEEYENGDTDPEFEEVIEKMRSKLDGLRSDGGLVTTDDDLQSSLCNRCKTRKRKLIKKDDSVEMSKTIAKSVVLTRLTKDEASEQGVIKPSVFLNFIKAIGILPFSVFIVCIGIYQGLNMFSNIWLSIWTQKNAEHFDNLNDTTNTSLQSQGTSQLFYLMVYLGLGVLQGIFLYISFHLILTRMAVAAGKLHNKMLESILRSPSSFFDTTPTGRIINRFSSDVDAIDSKLPLNFRIFSLMSFSVLAILIVISILTPLFLINIFFAGIIYALLVRYFLPTVRLMRRLETVRRSPIYNHFSETLTGASIIRAFKCGQRFAEEFRKRIDNNSTFYYASFICTRWIGIRVETISNVIILISNIVTIASGLSGSEVGLSISYAIMITITINIAVFSVSELLMDTVSVERIADYTTLPAEEDVKCLKHYRPLGWPQSGRIDFHNYMTRYRDGLDLVLKGISLTINSGEKVGVVGRTGAGKSSLTLSLFRMLEATSGVIFIDGEDISTLQLNVLRTNLTILPQDPVLFSGSLRFNLDPFGCFNDDDMWRAIECAHLKQFVEGSEYGLEYECGEGGQNLSIGQRQLVCLARTLLHKTKILILDEATAAVDIETDELIQDTIRTQFKECTVLTIAHRLHTVMDYDRVVVMESGCIKEVDAPQTLLHNPNTVFYGMAKDAGLV